MPEGGAAHTVILHVSPAMALGRETVTDAVVGTVPLMEDALSSTAQRASTLIVSVNIGCEYNVKVR